MARWPHDDPQSLKDFYGDPAHGVEGQLVQVVPPFKMYYEGRPIKAIPFHQKAAPALKAALNAIWEHVGHDQKKLDALGVSNYSGSYNKRMIRGSSTRWSNHAYGAAIDIDAEHEGLGTTGHMPQFVIDAFKAQGALWGGDYHGRKDPMHFEFCSRGDAVGLIDAPQVDNDSDTTDSIPGPEPDASEKTPWYKKIWPYLSGGGLSSLAGGIYDYRVAIVMVAAILIIFTIVWFTYLRKKLEKDG